MKLTGKGSLASVIRRILDVLWIVLWVALGGVIVAAIVWAAAPQLLAGKGSFVVNADFLKLTFSNPGVGNQSALTTGVLALAVVGIIMAQLVITRLRKIFRTLSDGVIFNRENAVHIRAIGIICICGGIVQTLASMAVGALVAEAIELPGIQVGIQPGNSLAVVFLGLVILVISEVFRMAAALQEDHDLTI